MAIVRSATRKRAAYRHLAVCGNLWTCPVCAAKISETRRRELVAAVDAHKAAGGYVYLVTRTFPHGTRDDVADLLARLKTAEDKYKSGAPYKRLVDRFGIVGTIRAVEATYGENGWHPHIHELLFTSAPLDQSAAGDALYDRWLSACRRAGLGAPSREHGLDVRDGSYAARYASKWGVESELTKWHLKQGKGLSLTPFDLLRVAQQSGSKPAVARARSLFLEYAEAFRGKRQLVWSPGLKSLIPEQTSDDDAAAATDDDAQLLAHITKKAWLSVFLFKEIRAQALEYATISRQALELFLTKHLPPGETLSYFFDEPAPPPPDTLE